MKKLLAGIGALAVACSAAHAGPTISRDLGTLFETTGISAFDVTGADMNEMAVEMCFSSGCDNFTWGELPRADIEDPLFYGVQSAGGWSLRALGSGDTFLSPFLLEVSDNFRLLSFTLYGLNAGIVFDTVPASDAANNNEPNLKTPGAGDGLPFTFVTGAVAGVAVNYFDAVGVPVQNNVQWFGDVFLGMKVSFADDGFFGSMSFLSDTDRATGPIVQSDPTPPGTVPVPGTLLLAGLGLACLGFGRRRMAAA
jgi:hypothetical protein